MVVTLNFNNMETLTADEFKKRYGAIALSQFDQQKKEEDLFTQIKDAYQGGINKLTQGVAEAKPIGGTGDLIGGVGKIIGGATEAITSPLAPVFAPVGKAVNAIGNKISDIPAVQKFANSPAGEFTSRVAEDVGNYDEGAGLVAGGPKIAKLPAEAGNAVAEGISKVAAPKIAETVGATKSAIRDIIPTRQNLIDHSLARGLDLTPGDLTTIKEATGNEMGPWMAENNLIGNNKAGTQQLLNSFFQQNYKEVRSQVAKVDTVYKPSQVKGYVTALKNIYGKLNEVPGMEKQAVEAENLLNKQELTLEDVQKVKELVDKHLNLYNNMGDVRAGMEKQGLANIRNDLKSFIEGEVKKNTGVDIQQLNNNVATSREVLDAIDARATRGITRSHLTWREAAIGLGLTYFGSPIIGLAAVAIEKILTSSSIQLRFARYLDKLTDAQKAKISQEFRDNSLSKETKEILGVSSSQTTKNQAV